MGMLEREMKNLARQAGGSHKTVHDRIATAGRFCERLMELNIQIRYVHHLKAKHIEAYIQMRLAQGIQKQTLHNETAAIRKILTQAGAKNWRRVSGYPINRWGWLAYPAMERGKPSRRNIINRWQRLPG